ncbi:MAG: ferredoxin [Desulfacinum sp.]|jgi:uncharacterized 2Fe-2S/4Fe-4S cluster protein (DUF4445 family)|nr:ferredoxin [Desulfacinum sp.]
MPSTPNPSKPTTHTITFLPVGRRLELESGHSLLEAARLLAADGSDSVDAPCGGLGLCGRCRVRILEGPVEPPTAAEKRLLSAEELADGLRLACQAVPRGSLRVEIPPEVLASQPFLQVDGQPLALEPDPPVRRLTVPVRPTGTDRPLSVWQQVERSLSEDHGLETVRIDPALVRNTDPLAAGTEVTLSLYEDEVIALHWTPPQPPLGLAVDLGTTKIAGYLVELETGRVRVAHGIMNPQIRYGEDVISRLSHALAGREQARTLARLARQAIGQLAAAMIRRLGCSPAAIEDTVIAANTAMTHLLLEWPVAQLAQAPYVAASTAALELKAYELELDFSPGSRVFLVPGMAGFVGGDHTAMILGSDIHTLDGHVLGVDIGTNTEIVLRTPAGMFCCSCASGPAFEGAHIQHGMRAVQGAICRVRTTPDNALQFSTIGGGAPLGLCGSAMLDVVRVLREQGILSPTGILDRSHPRVRLGMGDSTPEVLLVEAAATGIGRDIVITQRDLSSIQLAKAAIAAGIALLLDRCGLDPHALDQVIVAGAFGTHLDLESAVAIGLLPQLPPERFRQVGNAAGLGAQRLLISRQERRRAERLARSVRYLELAAQADFPSAFARALYLRPMGSEPDHD